MTLSSKHDHGEAPPSVVYTSPSTGETRKQRPTTCHSKTTLTIPVDHCSPSRSSRRSSRRVVVNDKDHDSSSSTVATSPISVASTTSEEGRGEQDDLSLSSSSDRAQRSSGGSSSPSQRSTFQNSINSESLRRVRSIVRSIEEPPPSLEKQQLEGTRPITPARPQRRGRRTPSSAKSEQQTHCYSKASDPEYQARRDKRLQKTRARRQEQHQAIGSSMSSSSSSLDDMITMPTTTTEAIDENETRLKECSIPKELDTSSQRPMEETSEDVKSVKESPCSQECDGSPSTRPSAEQETTNTEDDAFVTREASIPPVSDTTCNRFPIASDEVLNAMDTSSIPPEPDRTLSCCPPILEMGEDSSMLGVKDDDDDDDDSLLMPEEADTSDSNSPPVVKEDMLSEDETCLKESHVIPPQAPVVVQTREPKSPPSASTSCPIVLGSDVQVLEIVPSSCNKLKELRACKTERETQLRHLMHTSASSSLGSSSHHTKATSMSSSNHSRSAASKSNNNNNNNSSHHRRSVDLIEPVVYDCMREELLKAYGIIAMQKKQLEQHERNRKRPPMETSNSTDNNNNSVLIDELRQQIDQLQRDKASRELTLYHRLTTDALEYKKTIDHWKRETICWKDRFDSSWENHEAKMRRSKAEKDEWRQRAIEAEQDLVSFKSGTEDTMFELIRAKERIHQLEEQMQHPTSILVATKTTLHSDTTVPPDASRKTFVPETQKSLAGVTLATPPKQIHQQESFLKDFMTSRDTPKDSRLFARFTAPWGK